MTMSLVTREIAFAAEVADRVNYIDMGVIAEQRPPDAIMRNPG